jgi:myo-inositol-1(or 4)-monophosphatase
VPDPLAASVHGGDAFAGELSLAIDLARRAGAIQMERYERLERIVHKSERDVVTEVDELCERLILDGVRVAHPDDAILAEESGAHVSHRGRGRAPDAGAERVWIVDPLDGTVNYANGIPLFCVSIALVVRGRASVGVVYDPVRDELFSGVVGGGARLDGVPIHHPAKDDLRDCVITLALPYRGWRRRDRNIRRRVRVTRDIGSASLSLAYVANGRFDAFVHSRGLSLWDVAAAGIICAEAGVTVTNGRGGPWLDLGLRPRGAAVVAAPAAHHATLLELLAAGVEATSGSGVTRAAASA